MNIGINLEIMDEIEQDLPESSGGLRRAFTLRNTAARQVVNFMPSRQLSYDTLRLRRSNSSHGAFLESLMNEGQSPEQKADVIVREMEQHDLLMEDNPDADHRRREALRDLPQGLTLKRHVRAKLSASVSLRSKRKPISFWKRLKYRIGFATKRANDRIRNLVFSIELWYEAIRKIEGNFGSAVGSYFYFLRWLFVFNVGLLTLVTCFLVLPQALYDSRVGFGRERGHWMDYLSGKGVLENSLLFYGHYHSGDVSSAGSLTYNMSFAYFYTMVSLYLLFFGVLCYRTAYSYRLNFIETGGGVRHAFSNKVFSGWDFGIASDRAAALSARSVYNEFKELLAEQNRKSRSTSLCAKIGQYLANIIVTALVLGCIAGLQIGLWRLLSLNDVTVPHWELLISAAITVIVSGCPMIFSLVIKLEYYTPRVALYVTLCRTCLLDVSTMFLLLFFWNRPTNECWETSYGQEAYRLVLLDAVLSLFVFPIFEFIRGLIFKVCPKATLPEFNIAYNSLTLIYNQAVLWFGMLFSPLLVAAVTIKLLCLFYVKRFVAFHACIPARKVWRAAQTQTVMYMLVTVSLFTALFGLGTLFFKNPSPHCGPFTNYTTVYEIVTEGTLSLSHNRTLNSILVFLTRPAVIAFVLLFLCVAVYYMRARSQAQRSMVDILKQMLVLEAKDKDFLLSAIAKVSNGEWLYNPRTGDAAVPDSHTWKYLHDDKIRKPSNAAFHFDVSRISHAAVEAPRPKSFVVKERGGDGDTDSSFSWQGSGELGERSGERKWI